MTNPTKHYGGIPREGRINDGDDGPWCDKAWHLSGEKVAASVVLTCGFCGRVYARCAQCQHGNTSAQCSMRAHVYTCRNIRRRPRHEQNGSDV